MVNDEQKCTPKRRHSHEPSVKRMRLLQQIEKEIETETPKSTTMKLASTPAIIMASITERSWNAYSEWQCLLR